MKTTFEDNIKKMLETEANQPPRWFYLSFSEEHFLGGVFIEAKGLAHALAETHAIGINPGGEVLSMEISREKMNLVPSSMRNRILTREEVEGI